MMVALRYFFDQAYRHSTNDKWSRLGWRGMLSEYYLEISTGLASFVATLIIRDWAWIKSPVRVSWVVDYEASSITFILKCKHRDLSAKEAVATLKKLHYVPSDLYIEDNEINVLNDREVEICFRKRSLNQMLKFESEREEVIKSSIKVATASAIITYVLVNWIKKLKH